MTDYDPMARGYARLRAPDPRVGRRIARGLGDARTVLNVGAGTGSYEPADRLVVAVEPSRAMIARRPRGAAPAVRAAAEALPFADASFDAAMAILTLHHWSDRARGVRELRRVAARVVILTWDPAIPFWLTEDYLPEVVEADRARFPAPAEIATALGGGDVEVVPIPRDCRDGFLAAYWARPEAYLDPATHDGISTFRRLGHAALSPGLSRLRADLDSGALARRHPELSTLDALDAGYRLIVTG